MVFLTKVAIYGHKLILNFLTTSERSDYFQTPILNQEILPYQNIKKSGKKSGKNPHMQAKQLQEF